MQAITTSRAAPGALFTLAHALRVAATHVATLAHQLDGWLLRRARRSQDREALAQMSDYELKDIGLSQGYRDQVAAGAWRRDLPY
jgi:uncharacterized protein YjiS (DUF1127 family)